MLKGIETMIDVQRMIKDIKKLAGEANTVVTEMEEDILWASINNQMTNATNISEISEDLRFLVQSNMEERVFQVQRMLANELDRYEKKAIVMWTRTFGKFKTYILMKDNRRRIKEKKKKRK